MISAWLLSVPTRSHNRVLLGLPPVCPCSDANRLASISDQMPTHRSLLGCRSQLGRLLALLLLSHLLLTCSCLICLVVSSFSGTCQPVPARAPIPTRTSALSTSALASASCLSQLEHHVACSYSSAYSSAGSRRPASVSRLGRPHNRPCSGAYSSLLSPQLGTLMYLALIFMIAHLCVRRCR